VPGYTRDSWAQTGTRILQTWINLTTIPTHQRTLYTLHSAAADSTAAPPKMPVSVQKHRGEPVPRVRVPVPARAESRSLRHMGFFSISAVNVEELVKFMKLLHKQQTT